MNNDISQILFRSIAILPNCIAPIFDVSSAIDKLSSPRLIAISDLVTPDSFLSIDFLNSRFLCGVKNFLQFGPENLVNLL